MTIRAYAKINLGLRVTGKRDDGFHNIETIFHRIDLYDTLTFERRESGIVFECSEPALPKDSSNLCVKAASLVLDAMSGLYDPNVNGQGVSIHLKKNIPLGAGLGGGSSDAAAVLRCLPNLLSVNLPETVLFDIALRLGSDVPYFLLQGSAYATGRGETLTVFDLEIPYTIVTVYPNVHVSTAWAYKHLDLRTGTVSQGMYELIAAHFSNPDSLKHSLTNDFETAVFEEYPVIRKIKEGLYALGARFALMSGSGSSVFGLFETDREALEVFDQYSKRYRVFLTAPYFKCT